MTYLTKEEVKSKWCPQAGVEASRIINTIDPLRCCIGSACMAWRKGPPCRRDVAGEPKIHETGYCGLAGDPK